MHNGIYPRQKLWLLLLFWIPVLLSPFFVGTASAFPFHTLSFLTVNINPGAIDPAALKFVKGEAGPLSQNGMIETNEVQPGNINIGVVDSQGITGDGNIIQLTFDVTGAQGSTSPMDVVVRGAFGTDLKNVANNVAGGTITVGPPGSGSGGKPGLSLAPVLVILAIAAIAAIQITGRR